VLQFAAAGLLATIAIGLIGVAVIRHIRYRGGHPGRQAGDAARRRGDRGAADVERRGPRGSRSAASRGL